MSFLGVSDIGVALIIPGVLELVGEHLDIYFFDQQRNDLFFHRNPPAPSPRHLSSSSPPAGVLDYRAQRPSPPSSPSLQSPPFMMMMHGWDAWMGSMDGMYGWDAWMGCMDGMHGWDA